MKQQLIDTNTFNELISKLNNMQLWTTFFPEEKEKTIGGVFEEFTEEQKKVVYFLVACALKEKSEECISKEVIKERLLYLCRSNALGPSGPFIWNVIFNGLPHEWTNEGWRNFRDERTEND